MKELTHQGYNNYLKNAEGKLQRLPKLQCSQKHIPEPSYLSIQIFLLFAGFVGLTPCESKQSHSKVRPPPKNGYVTSVVSTLLWTRL